MLEGQSGQTELRNPESMRTALQGFRAPLTREAIRPQIVEAYRNIANLDIVEQALVARNEARLAQVKSAIAAKVIDLDEGFLLVRAIVNEVSLESRKDGTTGLLNKNGFEERLTNLSKSADETGQELTVGVADLRGFKGVNDAIGHAAGDAVLVITANFISEQLRFYDTLARQNPNGNGTQSSAARPHGDEFLLACPGMGPELLIQRFRDPAVREHYDEYVKRELLKLVQQPKFAHLLQKNDGSAMTLEQFIQSLSPLQLGIRFGFAQYTQGDNPETLIKKADDDMNAQRQFEDPNTRSQR